MYWERKISQILEDLNLPFFRRWWPGIIRFHGFSTAGARNGRLKKMICTTGESQLCQVNQFKINSMNFLGMIFPTNINYINSISVHHTQAPGCHFEEYLQELKMFHSEFRCSDFLCCDWMIWMAHVSSYDAKVLWNLLKSFKEVSIDLWATFPFGATAMVSSRQTTKTETSPQQKLRARCSGRTD